MLNKMANELKFYLSTFTGVPIIKELSVSELFDLDRAKVCEMVEKHFKESL